MSINKSFILYYDRLFCHRLVLESLLTVIIHGSFYSNRKNEKCATHYEQKRINFNTMKLELIEIAIKKKRRTIIDAP